MEYQIDTSTTDLQLFKDNVLASQILVSKNAAEEKTLLDINSLNIEKSDVILHAFDWPYAYVTANAKEIAELGYRSVLVSPAMKSFVHKDGTAWWQRYQPQDYRVIENQLGNTQDFSEMIKALEEQGVRVYVDVVFNHMANEAYRRKDLQYPCAMDIKTYNDNKEKYQPQTLFGDLSEPLFHEEHFVDAFEIKDWKNTWEVQNGRITGGAEDPGLPKLKVCDYVIEQQQNYLKALKKMGVQGFRIDAAKHMTIEHLQRIWTKDITENMHIFGEIITDGGATKEEYELFLKPYIEQTELGAYDFPLFNTLFQALQKDGDMKSLANPYSVGQALFNFRATTFAITHDIPNNDTFKSLILKEQDEWLAYSYILGRDGGVPLVYTDLNPSKILTSNGIPRWTEAWKDPRMAKMIMFHNYAHGETMRSMLANKDTLVFARGIKGIVAINKSDSKVVVDIQWHKDMRNILTDCQYKIEADTLTLSIDRKSCLLLV
ncbi:alpha-amylase family protein [Psychromonas antarctica]|uniref:alpha-amylase family protein n=1 Tax=Psychromonas antarctica TaxID=67573 RepID=UPI001EE7D169|nr:alpha-amylase family protein [Psychromonas antarctica]MCG6202413.1 alpha-amylase family protein [Psychromonas antarctica]